MNRNEHLLTCLAEECAEVAQRVSKALRFGLDESQPRQSKNNRERIVEELQDLFAVVSILHGEQILPYLHVPPEIIRAKRDKIERFMSISRQQGVLS